MKNWTEFMKGVAFSPGLMRKPQRDYYERQHESDVFQKHGINQAELALMGRDFCIKLVNARRAVERGIYEASGSVLFSEGIGYRDRPNINLPPVEPFHA